MYDQLITFIVIFLEGHPTLNSKQRPAFKREEQSKCCAVGGAGRRTNDINYGGCDCHHCRHHCCRHHPTAFILITHMFMVKNTADPFVPCLILTSLLSSTLPSPPPIPSLFLANTTLKSFPSHAPCEGPTLFPID